MTLIFVSRHSMGITLALTEMCRLVSSGSKSETVFPSSTRPRRVIALVSKSPLLQSVAWTYTWLFRSIPLIVNLLFWYNLSYLYPSLSIGIPFGPSFWSGETLDLFSPMAAAVGSSTFAIRGLIFQIRGSATQYTATISAYTPSAASTRSGVTS